MCDSKDRNAIVWMIHFKVPQYKEGNREEAKNDYRFKKSLQNRQ